MEVRQDRMFKNMNPNAEQREYDASGGTRPRGFASDTEYAWPLIRANQLVELVYGKALVEANRKLGDVPVYGTNGRCGWHDTALFTGPGIILGRKGMGPLGVEWSAGDYWVIDTAYSVKPLTDALCMKYFYYLVKYVGLNHLKDGTSNPSLSRDTFGAQLFPFPPISEQRAIAAVLGSLDDKIELNRRMNRTLEEMAAAIFKAWFVDFEPVKAKAVGAKRFPTMPQPVFDALPADFTDSPLGPIPKGWDIQAVYDLADFVNGGVFRSDHFATDRSGLPIIKIAELKNGITNQTKFSTQQFDEKYHVASGDLLFSWSGSPETSIDTFIWTGGDGWLNQHVFRVLPHPPFDRASFYRVLKYLNPTFIEIARNKQTTGLGHVTAQDLKRLCIAVPPPRTLEAFNALLDPMFVAGYQNQLQSTTLAAIRDTLLSKLLSGEIRVGTNRE